MASTFLKCSSYWCHIHHPYQNPEWKWCLPGLDPSLQGSPHLRLYPGLGSCYFRLASLYIPWHCHSFSPSHYSCPFGLSSLLCLSFFDFVRMAEPPLIHRLHLAFAEEFFSHHYSCLKVC